MPLFLSAARAGSRLCVEAERQSDHGVVRDHFTIPLGAEFGGSLPGFEIDVVNPKALAVAIAPLEVVMTISG